MPLFSFFKGSSNRMTYVIQGKNYFSNNAKHRIKIANLNGDNVEPSNLVNVNFFFFKLLKLSSKTKIICYYFKMIPWLPKKQNSSYHPPHKSKLNESKHAL
jgi:hypothetical protein